MVRKRIFKRDNFVCAYCGKSGGILECDHIIPLSRGGSNHDEQEHHIQNVTTIHLQSRVLPIGFITSGFEETATDAASGHGRITLNLHTVGTDAFDIGRGKTMILRHWLDVEER